ncbi:hypothetical protein AVEN_154217-1 [Araneus ventricosus]|uniref:Uncharacterized protein n=1 Tax=Araneus ventricosus TaxID=182803 RepID=A0A4Y2GRR2_ARAVE|nr:hypothetical protein AVEN_154217-1 [Araneus ventricosus]
MNSALVVFFGGLPRERTKKESSCNIPVICVAYRLPQPIEQEVSESLEERSFGESTADGCWNQFFGQPFEIVEAAEGKRETSPQNVSDKGVVKGGNPKEDSVSRDVCLCSKHVERSAAIVRQKDDGFLFTAPLWTL